MKKIIVLMLMVLFLSGCGKNKEKEINNGDYLFTDVIWTRDSGHDIEKIIFREDGSFSYSCACGNAVNDSDLCESYTYNDETKEIKFNCFETTEEMITNVKVVEISEDILKLNFNGEIRKFEKANN